MIPSEYLKQSERTEHTPAFIRHDEPGEFPVITAQLTHAQMGLVTEVGEFTDALKKLLIYGKPIDRTNLIEELGDIEWYIALACRALGVTYEEVWDRNIAKLRARYPKKFESEQALNRDLDAERKALEDETPVERPIR